MSDDYFERPSREAPWPRLFNRLKARKSELAELILTGALDQVQYANHTGRYAEVSQAVEDMQAMMRGEDMPRKTELPEA